MYVTKLNEPIQYSNPNKMKKTPKRKHQTTKDSNIKKTKVAHKEPLLVGNELIGTIDIARTGDAYVIIENIENDIFIHRKNVHGAFDGDTVKVKRIHNPRSNRKVGIITEIIERKRSIFIGVADKQSKYCFVKADNVSIKNDFFIPEKYENNVKHGDKVVIEFIEWKKKDKNPIGKISEILGQAGSNDIEMKAIIVENGFFTSFPTEVLEEAEAIPTKISNSEIKKRKDFRNVTTLTIDPDDAKDFDDAISFQKVTDDTFQIGIHIADVSHYVQENTALDKEAYKRATSVYLVDRVAPMLPENISNIICSLRPNEEKLCFSAVFIIDKNAKVLDIWFGRTVIFSDRRLTYNQAQEIIEGKDDILNFEINTLNKIATQLRKIRFKNGSLDFDAPEPKFQLDETGKPIGIIIKERKAAHMLIEEFMLLANRYVAYYVGKEKNASGKTPMVYRVHDLPNIEKLQDFALFAAKFGYKANFDNPKKITQTLNTLMEKIHGKPEQNLLESLAIRSMAKAIYTTKNIGHYGLGFEYYTHFTSPIRRYPDIMVHRLLQIVLDGKKMPALNELEQKCGHSSEREKAAAEAERTSVKYKMAEFMLDRIGESFQGVISGVKNWGIYVELPDYNCEGLLRTEYLTDDTYLYDEKNIQFVGKRTGNIYQLGETIEVILENVDIERKTIDFRLK